MCKVLNARQVGKRSMPDSKRWCRPELCHADALIELADE
jgi:hypothetical protein